MNAGAGITGHVSRHALCVTVLLAFATSPSLHAQDLAIQHVQPSAIRVESAQGTSVDVRFELTAPAEMKLQLYDGRDLLVREIASNGVLRTGLHALTWDLRDRAGRSVPPEAYTYVLEARASDGMLVRYDLADATAGEQTPARDVKWDAHSGYLSYVLDRPSRVNVRLGLKDGGPLLRTLVDWVVRPAGPQRERWEGKDASGVLEFASHPKLSISVQAFSLPENSIVVGAPPQQVNLIDKLDSVKRREAKTSQPKRMYAHAQQPLETRGDFKVQLTLPASLPRTRSGVPIIARTTPLRLNVDAADWQRATARRFEPVFFIDGQFAFESELGFVPMTWNFDPATLNPGEHYLTVNLRGYEGNFGIATVKVLVQREAVANGDR